MDDERSEWLPADWKVCVRVRSSGRKDKYYINPLNGIKFNSKPEVLRYLKEAEDGLKFKEAENNQKLNETESDLKLKETESDLKLKKPNKTISQKTDAEKLPSGWTKEIKITKRGGKTRREPYYSDPVSGLQFRSVQEVTSYLETKDSEKVESKGDETNDPTEELKDHSKSSTVVAEEQRLTDKKDDKVVAGDDSNKSEGGAVENSNLPVTNTVGQTEEKDSVGEDRKQETPQNKRKKSNNKWLHELPRRTSKRLARMEADSPLELETSNGATEAPSEKAQANTIESTGKSEINTSGDIEKQEEPISEPNKDISSVEEQEASTEAEISNIINTTGKSEACISGDFDKEGELTKEDGKNGKDLDPFLDDIFKVPCVEFAVKMLTDAIPIEDVIKAQDNRTWGSSSAAPFGDIWADPCFNFAVTTLTSEILTENGSGCRLSAHKKGCNNSITK